MAFQIPRLQKVGALPSGITFVDNGDGTATLSGTPSSSTVGEVFTFTITASNGLLPNATQTFTLLIQPVLPPSNFTGVIKKNKFLNKTEYVLIAKWKSSPSPGITSYKIYKNGVLVDAVSAYSPLVFKTCVNSNNSKINYQIVAVNSAHIASHPISITTIEE